MTVEHTSYPEERLALRSQLCELAQLRTWIERLASRYAIPDDVQFAINLCLEESIANVILHGYGGEAHGSVTVSFAVPQRGQFVFVVDDEARPFDPLQAPETPALSPGDEIRIGGQGIRLLREFANALHYERTPAGNRLRMLFSTCRQESPLGFSP
jgi:serine/threonine-protein kinase RsbW